MHAPLHFTCRMPPLGASMRSTPHAPTGPRRHVRACATLRGLGASSWAHTPHTVALFALRMSPVRVGAALNAPQIRRAFCNLVLGGGAQKSSGSFHGWVVDPT